MRPERTCIGCRERRQADALVRWRLAGDGFPTTSPSASGRGAWLCADRPECLAIALRRQAFDRAWKTRVPPEVLARLTDTLPVSMTDMRQ